MGVAIVTGVTAILGLVVSWLLSNGSRRNRLLTRIERQTAILAAALEDGGRGTMGYTEDVTFFANPEKVTSPFSKSSSFHKLNFRTGSLLNPDGVTSYT